MGYRIGAISISYHIKRFCTSQLPCLHLRFSFVCYNHVFVCENRCDLIPVVYFNARSYRPPNMLVRRLQTQMFINSFRRIIRILKKTKQQQIKSVQKINKTNFGYNFRRTTCEVHVYISDAFALAADASSIKPVP